MQEIVHQMIELEQKAAALVKEAEAEASRITESAGLECEKLIHEERQKASEAARSLSTEARKQAEAARREQVARAMQALDRELNAAESKHEAGVAAVLDAVLKHP